jgi:hypothetical protein
MAISLRNNHWSQQHQANTVIHPVTGKEMEYSVLMKDPRLQPLWTRGFGNKCGCLFQGIRDIPGTDTCFFIDLKNIPNDINITYSKLVCDKNHTRSKRNVSANRRRPHTRILRRRCHFNGRYHNFQYPDQHHPLHQGSRNDDDGNKELLYRHPTATFRIHENAAITLSRGNNPKVRPQRSSHRRLGLH